MIFTTDFHQKIKINENFREKCHLAGLLKHSLAGLYKHSQLELKVVQELIMSGVQKFLSRKISGQSVRECEMRTVSVQSDRQRSS